MTRAQRAKVEQRLRELQRELTVKAPRKIEPNRTSDAKVGGDEDEQPLNEMQQAIASARNRNDATLAAKVERALSRLRDDPEAFGECADCDEEIPLARLLAMPYAELCVACQAKRDANRPGPARRKLTDYV
ncbi:MAG: TraR/DksA family transcriptional regulator [Myxococcaceae bacterium]